MSDAKDPNRAAREEQESRARARAELGIERLGAGEELIDSATFTELNAQLIVTPPPNISDPQEELLLEEIAETRPLEPKRDPAERHAPSGPDEVLELEARIAGARSREDVIRATLRIARAHASTAALLVVSRGTISGLAALGGELEERIGGVLISSETGSLFASPVVTRRPFRGPPPESGVDIRILRAMGRGKATDVAVLPISIGDRVINLLYVDNGESGLSETGFASLLRLCECVSDSYQRLILARRSPR